MAEYQWPILKRQKIVEALKVCEIPNFTVDVLLKPTAETVEPVYKRLCELLLGDQMGEMSARAPEILQSFGVGSNDVNIYVDSLGELSFYRSLERLMRASGISNFSLQKDLFHPTSKRLTLVLSGIINFAWFREGKLEMYDALAEDIHNLLDKKERELAVKQSQTDQLNRLWDRRAQEEPLLQELGGKEKMLQKQIETLSEKINELVATKNAIKKVTGPLKQQREDIESLIQSVQNDIEKNEKGIVDDPALLFKNLEDLKSSVEREKKTSQELEKRRREVSSSVQELQRVERDLDKCIELMEECRVEMERSKSASRERKNLKRQLEEEKVRQQELEDNLELARKEQSNAADSQARLEGRRAEKLEEAKQACENSKKEYEQATARSNTEFHNAVEENVKETKRIEMEIREAERQHSVRLAAAQSRFTELIATVDSYHARIKESLTA